MILLCCGMMFPLFYLSAQNPAVFNYQAVYRVNGEVAANVQASILVSVRQQASPDSILWEGSYVVQTNDFGLFNISVGDPQAATGNSLYTTLDSIEWSKGQYFITVAIDNQDMGNVPLVSVPYSMYAQVSDSLTGTPVYIQPAANASAEDALFAVRNREGQTVFAVYNEGVRVYLDTAAAKGARGGFAIGGFGAAKGNGKEYFRVTDDSTRVYVKTEAKGRRGGFAIGGYDAIKGSANRFLDLSPQNYFIGHESGRNNTTGVYNIFLGYNAGYQNTEGNFNTFIGYKSGYSNIGYDSAVSVLLHGQNNTFVGFKTGYSNTMGDYNTFIGSGAGISNKEGRQNIFIGYYAGESNDQGYFNIFLGNYAGRSNTSGYDNLFVGNQTGGGNLTGTRNTYLGTGAGKGIATGSNNTMVGYYACPGIMAFGDDGTGNNNVYVGYQTAYSNKNGSGNVFIGYQAGYNATDVNNKLYIDNTATDNPLIYGEFDNRLVKINGDLCYSGTLGQCSDLRLKKRLVPIGDISASVLSLEAYYFHWKRPNPAQGFSPSRQVGLVAQEVQEVFPELVSADGEGTLYVDYSKLSPLLLQVIKEQQKQLNRQEGIIDELLMRVARLENNSETQAEQVHHTRK